MTAQLSAPVAGLHTKRADVGRPEHFRPDIQGLRAIAVGAVVLFHGEVHQVPGGYVGVDVFFVISGFLISSHLLRSLRTSGRIGFGRFYAQRARRILPASFLVIFATVALAPLFVTPLQYTAVLRDAIATALYVPNYAFAASGANYLNATAPPSLFQHYWSLGVEEQFYLLWPALLLGFFAAARGRFRSQRSLIVGIGAVTVVSLLACVVLTAANQPWAFFSLGSRAWEFAAGALVATVVGHPTFALPAKWSAAVSWLGILGLAAAILLFDDSVVFPGYAAALPVAATAFVILGNTWGGRLAPTALLSVRPAMFIGKISYSIYLVHWPMQMLPASAAAVGLLHVSRAEQLGLMAASIPVGYVLYRFIETPFRTSARARAMRNGRVLLLAGAASAATVAGCTVLLAGWYSGPIATPTSAAATQVMRGPVGTAFVPANLEPGLRGAAQTVLIPGGCELYEPVVDTTGCAFGSNSEAPLVVLFGDSHASQWFPALEQLANNGSIRVETQTKSGCPAPSVGVEWRGMPYAECSHWRDLVIRKLVAERPALVLLGAYQRDHDVADERAWSEGFADTIERLSPARVAVLVDTPAPPSDVPNCLSAHLSSTSACDVEPPGRFRALELEIARENAVQALDVDDYLCRDDVCPAVIGNTLVYRDGSHITGAMSALLAPVVKEQLEAALRAPLG